MPGRGGGSVTGWSRWWCRGASLLLSRSRSSGGAPRRAVLGLVARVGGGRSVHWAPACLVRWACCAAALTGGGPVGWVSGQVALCGLSRSSSRSTLAVHVILPLRLILLSVLLRRLCPVFPRSQSSMSVQVHASRRPRIAAAPHWLWSVPVGWAPSTPTGWVSEGVCSILPMCSRHSLFLFDLGCGCGLLSVQVPSSYGGCHR